MNKIKLKCKRDYVLKKLNEIIGHRIIYKIVHQNSLEDRQQREDMHNQIEKFFCNQH